MVRQAEACTRVGTYMIFFLDQTFRNAISSRPYHLLWWGPMMVSATPSDFCSQYCIILCVPVYECVLSHLFENKDYLLFMLVMALHNYYAALKPTFHSSAAECQCVTEKGYSLKGIFATIYTKNRTCNLTVTKWSNRKGDLYFIYQKGDH